MILAPIVFHSPSEERRGQAETRVTDNILPELCERRLEQLGLLARGRRSLETPNLHLRCGASIAHLRLLPLNIRGVRYNLAELNVDRVPICGCCLGLQIHE